MESQAGKNIFTKVETDIAILVRKKEQSTEIGNELIKE